MPRNLPIFCTFPTALGTVECETSTCNRKEVQTVMLLWDKLRPSQTCISLGQCCKTKGIKMPMCGTCGF